MANRGSVNVCKRCGEDLSLNHQDLMNSIPRCTRSPCITNAMSGAIQRTEGQFEAKYCRSCKRVIREDRKQKILYIPKLIVSKLVGCFK